MLRLSQENAFAWGDPDVVGWRLDQQTADFSWRAAELWTQAAGLRELMAGSIVCGDDGGVEEGEGGSRGIEAVTVLTGALEQARP